MDRRSRSLESRHYKRRKKSRSRSSSRGRRDRGHPDRDKYDRDRYDRDRERRRRRSKSRSRERSRPPPPRRTTERDLYREIIGQDYNDTYNSRERQRRRSREDDRNFEKASNRNYTKRHISPEKEIQSDSNDEDDGYDQSYFSARSQKTIILRGLSRLIAESDIRGDIMNCHLTPTAVRVLRKRKTGLCRGFGFVEFGTEEEAIRWMSYRQGFLELPGCRAKMQYSQPLVKDQKVLSDWYCVKCGALNFRRREFCFKCYASREESEKGGEGSDEVSNILTKKIMLRNLDVLTTEEGIATIMQEKVPQQVSKVTKILVCRDPLTQTSRGICYLYFDNLIDSMNTHNALKALDSPLIVDDREVMITYCMDSENKQILPKPSKQIPVDHSPAPNYTANTYQYTLADVPRLAEYSASMYASSTAEKEHFIKYYTNYYIAEITKGQYSNLPTMTQLDETSANSGAAVALSAIQRKLGKAKNNSNSRNFNKTYPMPDISTYQYDETSGYYYDPLTKLYYDPHSQYYYNNETGSYMYYDQEKRMYVVAPTASATAAAAAANPAVISAEPSTSGTGNENDLKQKDDTKKDAKQDKVKVAKKIVKDMEKWAKQLNQKKEYTHIAPATVTPTMTAPPAPTIAPAAPMIDIKPKLLASISKYADVGYSILESKEKPLLNVIEPPGINRLVTSYNSDSDEHDDMNNQNQFHEFSSEKDYVDFEKLTCLLCKRAFQSHDILNKHLKISKLHKDNLAKYNANKGNCNDSALSQEYRDRAKERRKKFGGDNDPAPVNRSKERFERELESATKNVQSQASSMPISENNVGNRLLQKMGWQEGQGLGKSNQGRTNIVEADGRNSSAGLGSKVTQFKPGDDYKSYIKRMMKSRYESVESTKK